MDGRDLESHVMQPIPPPPLLPLQKPWSQQKEKTPLPTGRNTDHKTGNEDSFQSSNCSTKGNSGNEIDQNEHEPGEESEQNKSVLKRIKRKSMIIVWADRVYRSFENWVDRIPIQEIVDWVKMILETFG